MIILKKFKIILNFIYNKIRIKILLFIIEL